MDAKTPDAKQNKTWKAIKLLQNLKCINMKYSNPRIKPTNTSTHPHTTIHTLYRSYRTQKYADVSNCVQARHNCFISNHVLSHKTSRHRDSNPSPAHHNVLLRAERAASYKNKSRRRSSNTSPNLPDLRDSVTQSVTRSQALRQIPQKPSSVSLYPRAWQSHA